MGRRRSSEIQIAVSTPRLLKDGEILEQTGARFTPGPRLAFLDQRYFIS